MDFDSELTVTFTPGVTAVQFNISIIDNDLTEGFMLSINPETLPPGAYLGDPYSVVVDIIDNYTRINDNSKSLTDSYR